MNNLNKTSGLQKTAQRIRTIIVGLTLAMLAGTGIAYASNNNKGGCGDQDGQKSKHSMHSQQGQQGMHDMLSLSSKVVEQLQLTDTQKIAFTDAQNATQKMRDDMRSTMRSAKESRQAEMKSDTFDPRTMFSQQDAMASQMLASRQGVQKQWLTFWDGLTDIQKANVRDYMQSKKESHQGKHRS
jgi:Spy/CpxP family protein refolding chaperone